MNPSAIDPLRRVDLGERALGFRRGHLSFGSGLGMVSLPAVDSAALAPCRA